MNNVTNPVHGCSCKILFYVFLYIESDFYVFILTPKHPQKYILRKLSSVCINKQISNFPESERQKAQELANHFIPVHVHYVLG